ncbi:ABC transporter, membrane spanning protein [Streptomyces bingchenggensis BCW-1]|uniref:ABC transporter, membrane spanning protein n=1 Tax=Streptomyces bingchenggensis (strain BCW-1) TaxID=749414 RepID=D7C0A2_STRBB|nr:MULTISPECIES: ABC transporter permease [Streptomyces]ADI03593.1 ABC transporter, membrane spanning protein [Streptomyces bingchenggensis BCW-1]
MALSSSLSRDPVPSTAPRRLAHLTATGLRAVTGRHWTLRIGAVVLALVLTVLLLTPWIAPYDPAHQDLGQRLSGPGAHHLLGTDQLGRDILSRLMYGGRFSVSIAAVTLLLSAVIGTVIGAFSARRGGIVDEVVMRTTDLLISIPDVIVALFLIAAFGTGYGMLIAALTIVGWTPFARLMRGLALEINSREYIEAAEALGCSKVFIVFRHVIPNALRPVLSLGFLRFGHKLITVGGLSYVGLGVQPPDSDWGAMLLDAQPYMQRLPLLVIAPGAAIFVTALSVTLIGHGMELKRKRRTDAS